MRKVTKILLKALSVTLLLLIFCPILLTLLVELPSVQNFVVQRATDYLSHKLETRVEIRRIRLGAMGSLRLDGLYVEDYQGDTLLFARKLKIFLARFDGGEGLTLRNGWLRGGKLYLRESESGEMNIKQVVSRLSQRKKDKPESDFGFRINDVQLDNFSLKIERLEHRNPDYGVDYGNMHLYELSAFIDDFTLDGAKVGGNVRNFTTRERSGFYLQNFTGQFLVDRGVIDLKNFNIQTEHSDVRLRSLLIKGEDWSSYKEFIREVEIKGELRNSSLASSDVAYFAPRLVDWDLRVSDVNLGVSGKVNNLQVKVDKLHFGESSSMVGQVRLRGLPNVKRSNIDLKLSQLTTTRSDLERTVESITSKQLPDKVMQMLEPAGEIVCGGELRGTMSDFTGEANLMTQIGTLALTAERKALPREKGKAATSQMLATVDLTQMHLGALLGEEMLGAASGFFAFSGVTSSQSVVGSVSGRVASVEINDCEYEEIDISGRVQNKSFSGMVRSDEAPAKFVLNGLADMNLENPIYDFKLDVSSADLHKMNINRRDSISNLRFGADLYCVGRNMEELNGTLSIDGGRYYYNADTLSTSSINLSARSSENQRSLVLSSDFADATFTGPSTYKEVMKYLQAAMCKYLPVLQDLEEQYMSNDDKGYSALSLTLKKIDPLLNAISDGLKMAEGSKLNFMMNPASNHLTLRAESDYLERNNMFVTKLNMNLTNQGDSLAMYLSSEDLYMGALHLPQLSVMGGAKNDRVLLSAGFADTLSRLSGVVGLTGQLLHDEFTGAHRLNVTINPATITSPSRKWRLLRSQVMIDTARVVVDNFRVISGEQQLQIDGVMSRSSEDSLTLMLKDFSISPFTGFAGRMGYRVLGNGNGRATMRAVMDRGELTADINIDSMSVNGESVAPLNLDSKWDFRQQRARIRLINRTTRDSVVRGYYAPKSGRYYAEGRLEKLPMSMLDPLLTGVVSNTKGSVNADLEIMGQGRNAKLNGEIDVKEASTTIDFTKARYSIPEGKVKVQDNHFIAQGVKLYDTEGNSGTFTMDLDLNHLSNIAYQMRIVPQSMIVLNTTQKDNDLFYGKVYASGNATINGSKKGTTLNISGTTDGNSHFYMPLSGKSDASSADFVIFEGNEARVDSTNYLLRRKMMFERRNRKSSTSSSNMTINIELNARPNTEVQLVIDPTVGDIIKARGTGALSMRIVPRDNIFDMYGDYTISEGSYLFTLQNIINKKFIIESGSTIQWTGDPLDARLNINAVYKLKSSLQPLLSSTTLDNVTRAVPVECIINLTERLTNPTVTFDIKVPNADSEIQNAVANLLNNQQSIATQFMYLLVSGSFYSDASSSSSIGASASATTGFELLSNQLSNWLSSDDYNIILRYRPRSELTSDEIDFGFSKSLVNNRLLVEVEGNYLVDNRMAASSNMSNFMGEAYITWLIDQAGYLKLKGFTQTIDRFDENQGLQETGLGIYYREDFDNWKDLKERVRDRFMSRRRREALAVQQEQELERQRAERDSLESKGIFFTSEQDSLRQPIDSLKQQSGSLKRDGADSLSAHKLDSIAKEGAKVSESATPQKDTAQKRNSKAKPKSKVAKALARQRANPKSPSAEPASSAESKPSESQPAEGKSADGKPSGSNVAQEKSTQVSPTDSAPAAKSAADSASANSSAK